MATRKLNSWGNRALRLFALTGMLISVLVLAGFWYAADQSLSWAQDQLDIASRRLQEVDEQIGEVQRAVEPYDLLSKDVSKQAASHLHELVHAVHDASWAQAIVSKQALASALVTTQSWKKALATRIPAQELVQVRSEVQAWRDEVNILRKRIHRWVYLCGLGFSGFVVWFGLTQWVLFKRLKPRYDGTDQERSGRPLLSPAA